MAVVCFQICHSEEQHLREESADSGRAVGSGQLKSSISGFEKNLVFVATYIQANLDIGNKVYLKRNFVSELFFREARVFFRGHQSKENVFNAFLPHVAQSVQAIAISSATGI
jgi:hypothetical protein